jgi:hypothetical protein
MAGASDVIYPMELQFPSPLYSSVLSRLLDPVGRCLTPDVAQRLVALQADPAVQARLEELADKCTESKLSADERTEYLKVARKWRGSPCEPHYTWLSRHQASARACRSSSL